MAFALLFCRGLAMAEERSPAGSKLGADLLKNTPWTGDLDGMVARRRIRVLVPYNHAFFFFDKSVTPRGIMADLMTAFDKEVNRTHRNGHRRVSVTFIPTPRDRLIPDLLAGKGDIVAANLTVTPDRAAQVDFTAPLSRGVRELVVSSANRPPLASLDELSGQEVLVSAAASYHQSLLALNESFKARGLAPVTIITAPGHFETEDALEMVNAGLIRFTVADDYMGRFWAQVFTNIQIHENLALSEPSDIALAIRKDSPQLRQALDAFIGTTRKGTSFGNQKLREYLRSVKWAKRATDPKEIDKVTRLSPHFTRYGTEYGLDWLLMMAMGYQESRLDQNVKSRVGAIGIMQIMPATGRELKVGDIRREEPNIHGGIKYVRRIFDANFRDAPMKEFDKALFALAAYNAGPGRLRSLRAEAERTGLDPNVWFENVERVAERRIGSETVHYVSNIHKYYYAYHLLRERMERRAGPEASAGTP